MNNFPNITSYTEVGTKLASSAFVYTQRHFACWEMLPIPRNHCEAVATHPPDAKKKPTNANTLISFFINNYVITFLNIFLRHLIIQINKKLFFIIYIFSAQTFTFYKDISYYI